MKERKEKERKIMSSFSKKCEEVAALAASINNCSTWNNLKNKKNERKKVQN